MQKLDIVAELLRLLLLFFSFGQSVLKMEMLRHVQDLFEKMSFYSTMPTISVLVYNEPKFCWYGHFPGLQKRIKHCLIMDFEENSAVFLN